MEKTIVSTGKTIDLAIEAALNQLGLELGPYRRVPDSLPVRWFSGAADVDQPEDQRFRDYRREGRSG